MKIPHTSPERAQEEKEALSLLEGMDIGLAFGNRLLLAALNMLPVLTGKVAWAVTTEKEALQECGVKAPDLVILSDDLEQGYGPSLIEELKDQCPDTQTLIFIEKETSAVVEECLEAGATGVCFHSNVTNGDGDFLKALRAMANNAVFYPQEVKKTAGYVESASYELVLPSDLTEREKEVLLGLSEGKSNKEIAESLFITGETVKTHIKHITGKLGVRDRTGAAIYAIKAGLGA